MVLGFLILISGAFTQAQEHGMGNGGGVICINGACKTLIDSGLAVSATYPDFWVPNEDLVKAVNSLVKKHPLSSEIRDLVFRKIFLNLTHFKVVEIVDPNKVNTIKDEYINLIKKMNPYLDMSNFQVVAISSDNTVLDPSTILLPAFFNLSVDQQAKVLIHEGLYRGLPSNNLKYVLQYEAAVKPFQDYVGYYHANDDINQKQSVDVQVAAYNLGFMDSGKTLAHFLSGISMSSLGLTNYSIDNAMFASGLRASEFYSILECQANPCDKISILIEKNNILKRTMDSRVKVALMNLPDQIIFDKLSDSEVMMASLDTPCPSRSMYQPPSCLIYNDKYGLVLKHDRSNYKIFDMSTLRLVLPK